MKTIATLEHLDIEIQRELECNHAGFRRLPGTALKDGGGRTVYTPPQDPAEIVQLMSGLERILNVLYLVKEGLLDTPVLYLSNHIVRTKADYYRLLQSVRAEDRWEDWVLYMLQAVETTARQTIGTVQAIKVALMDYKHRIRAEHKFYSQDLINLLFMHPYTKIEFAQQALSVSRLTASKYLDALAATDLVAKHRVGRSNYDVNVALNDILLRRTGSDGADGSGG